MINVLVVMGAVLTVVAIAVRLGRAERERAAAEKAAQELSTSLVQLRQELDRTFEDLHVLRTLLLEKNLLNEGEVAHARARLIELPRRLAEEREAISSRHGVQPTQILIEDALDKIH